MPGLTSDPAMELLDADPVDAGMEAPSADFVEEVPTGAPSRAEDPMEFAAADELTNPNAPAWSEPTPEPFAAEPEPVSLPEMPVDPGDTAPPASPPAPAVPDDALAQIAPALQEQLHETLEKIAWEAFGQVTETVVAQTVERLEKIAWEVVPKLAETLIAEEIRKLKER